MSLLKIVRPFQLNDFSPPKRLLPSSPQKEDEPTRLEPGKTGSVKSGHGSISTQVTFYVKKFPKETGPIT